MKEIIDQIIEEVLTVIVSKIEAGEKSINIHHLISSYTSKPIRDWEQAIGVVSVHQTVLVSQVGHKLEYILKTKYSHKNIKFRSSWGQDGKIDIF